VVYGWLVKIKTTFGQRFSYKCWRNMVSIQNIKKRVNVY
jgi:hypothetical protein